jgi:hypothetical protein
MTLSEEKLNREVASNFAPFQLLNCENFWTITQWATLETSTPHFCHLNFLTLLEKSFAEMFKITLVLNLLNQLLFKFGNCWPSRFSLVVQILALCPLKIWVNSN